MWRIPALVAAAVLVIAGSVALVAVPGGDDEQVAVTGADDHWMTLHVPMLDWRLEHPAAWRMQLFEDQCRVGESGAVITNLDRPVERATIPDGCTTEWDLSEVPDEFVGVQVTRAGGRLSVPDPSASDTPRPLRVEDFDRIDHLTLHQSITIAGETRYGVRVWIGPDALASDVAAVERVVGSINWTSDCPPRTPPPDSSTTFRVVLPDGRMTDSSQGGFDNEWELEPDDGTATVDITARVAQTVELDALRYVIKSDDADLVIKTFDTGPAVAGGTRSVLRWDLRNDAGTAVAPGRYHLLAVTEIGADGRSSCVSATGATEQFGLGYIVIPD